LFNEPRLSVNNTLSCASCHRLESGGADNKPFSLGFDGKPVAINTPTVFNASLNFKQFWNGRVDTLEAQIEQVVISPVEMGNDWKTVVQNLSALPAYQAAFKGAYPDGVTAANVQNALATYERTLLTPNSRFDQYLLEAKTVNWNFAQASTPCRHGAIDGASASRNPPAATGQSPSRAGPG
jgi:cytochrome c peroxidase